ncbi:MAG: EMC3/TMCO1 family protein [Promethearchaeota archaeon]
MFQQPEKKKKKYKLQKKKEFNFKKFIMITSSLSILTLMIIIFSAIDSIPWGAQFKATVQKAPWAAIFIFFFSVVINICSSLLGKALIDTNTLQRRMKLIKDHNKEKKEVEKLKNTNFKLYKKKMIKIKRREASIKKMTQNIGMQRMKPSCVTFIPMIILFFFIRNLFKIPNAIDANSSGFWFDIIPGGEVGIARTVMNPWSELSFLGAYLFPQPDVYGWGVQGFIGFTAYYFLCSFSVSSIVQRLSGLATSGMGGMSGFGNLQGMR